MTMTGQENARSSATKILTMSDGHEELIPCRAKLINADMQGKTKRCYIVWTIPPCSWSADLSELVTQAQAMADEETRLWVYFTNRNDLHVWGQSKPTQFINDTERDACWDQVEEILNSVEPEINELFKQDDKLNAVSLAWELLGSLATISGNVGLSLPYARADFEK